MLWPEACVPVIVEAQEDSLVTVLKPNDKTMIALILVKYTELALKEWM